MGSDDDGEDGKKLYLHVDFSDQAMVRSLFESGLSFQAAGKYCLPEDFDFTGSALWGKEFDYQFDRYLSSSGSQGRVVKFNGGGMDVVLKHHVSNKNESSRLVINPGDSFITMMNETLNLCHLDNSWRISRFLEDVIAKEAEGIRPNLGKLLDCGHFPGGYPVRNHALNLAIAWSYQNPEITSAPFPRPVDTVIEVMENGDGKGYLPFSAPSVGKFSFNSASDSTPFGLRTLITYSNMLIMGGVPVYECIPGQTLDEVLRKEVDRSKRESLVKSMVRAMMFLHGYGVLHRDVKPENLLVTDAGEVKVIDFGMATRFSPSDRVARASGLQSVPVQDRPLEDYTSLRCFGNRIFSAPSTFVGMVSNKDDVFSTGLIAAVMLTGEHPFLDDGARGYGRYQQLPSKASKGDESKKAVNRQYQAMMESFNKGDHARSPLVRNWELYVRRFESDPIIQAIATAFHPDPSMRPERMFDLGARLGVAPPVSKWYFEAQELFRSGVPVDVSEQKAYESLVSMSDSLAHFCYHDPIQYHMNVVLMKDALDLFKPRR